MTEPWIQRSRLRRLLLGLVVCSTALGFFNETPIQASVLHVVIVSDNEDPKIGAYVLADAANVDQCFGMTIPERFLNVVTLTKRITERGILNAIQALTVAPDDAILLYYAGHGGYGKAGEHNFYTHDPNQNPPLAVTRRNTVTKALKDKSPRLAVLISDACFNLAPEIVRGAPTPGAGMLTLPQPLLRRLFFQSSGFIDVNGCKKDQVAMTYRKSVEGSLFTAALCTVLLDNQEDGTIGWDAFLKLVDKQTAVEFRRVYEEDPPFAPGADEPQTTQTPYRFAMEVKTVTDNLEAELEKPRTRFGAYVAENNGRGVKVTGTLAGTSSTRIRFENGTNSFLEAGDIILTFDGVDVESEAQYRKLVASAPRDVEFEIINSRDGQRYRMSATLDKANGQQGQIPLNGGAARVRFGAYVKDHKGAGVMVTRTLEKTPSTKLKLPNGSETSLESGDVILSVNGTRVDSEQQFRGLIAKSPQQVKIEIVNVRDGQRYLLTATLDD